MNTGYIIALVIFICGLLWIKFGSEHYYSAFGYPESRCPGGCFITFIGLLLGIVLSLMKLGAWIL